MSHPRFASRSPRPATILAVVLAAACGNTGTDTSGNDESAGGSAGTGGMLSVVGGAGGRTNAGGTSQGGGGPIGGSNTQGGTVGLGGASGGGMTLLYAHTNDTLYSVDPTSFAQTEIGKFDCIGGSGQDTSMTDIAVSQDGTVFAISASKVYRLDITNGVHCAATVPLNNPKNTKFYALTFAPAGVLDPKNEVLVAGNTDGELWAIDNAGNLSLHGNLGDVPQNDGRGHDFLYPGGRFELSGDIVFLSNGGMPIGFATVRDCESPPSSSNCNPSDTLLQIDVGAIANANTNSVALAIRGMIVASTKCPSSKGVDFGSMYGIAALGGSVYGFSHNGTIAEISNDDGTACPVGSMGMMWSGAGVTTEAMVVAPPMIH